MPSFGGNDATWLDAGSDFGSAFGTFQPSTSGGSFATGWGAGNAIKQFDTPSTLDSISNMLNQYSQKTWGSTYGGSNPVGQMGGQNGASLGGDWSSVDQWNGAIGSASASTGVPMNVIKAIMKLESGGSWDATSPAGAWGPMQIYAGAWGDGPWMHDPVANIQKGAEILKEKFDQYGNWYDAFRAYHGFGSDGFTTDYEYADIVMGNLDTLNNAGGSAGFGFGGFGSGGGDAFSSIWGGGNQYGVSQEFGHTDWSTGAGSWMYGYGTAYGLDGTEHTGVDVATPYGTRLYVPVGGYVEAAGGTGYYTNNGNGGPGVGELRIRLDNGAILILGHMSNITVGAGGRVEAGDLAGFSGSENGDHVHVEIRIPDASTATGWRIVDPRTVLGSAFVGNFGGGGTANPYAGMSAIQMAMSGKLRGGGNPFPGSTSGIAQFMSGRR